MYLPDAKAVPGNFYPPDSGIYCIEIAHYRCAFLNPQVCIYLINWILWFKLTHFVSLLLTQLFVAVWNWNIRINRIYRKCPWCLPLNNRFLLVLAAPNLLCLQPLNLVYLCAICHFVVVIELFGAVYHESMAVFLSPRFSSYRWWWETTVNSSLHKASTIFIVYISFFD